MNRPRIEVLPVTPALAPKKGAMPDAFVWTGLVGGFEKAGFTEAARRSETRPIMRRRLRAPR